jgi:acyl carrier protein
MEKILISWLKMYVGAEISTSTCFSDLNFDIFDQAVVVDFVQQNFKCNINKTEEWYKTVKELLDAIAAST